MNYDIRHIFVALAFLSMVACKASKGSKSGAKVDTDFSTLRPSYTLPQDCVRVKQIEEKERFEVDKKEKPKKDLSIETEIPEEELQATLDTMATANRQLEYAQGYRIQIYSGNDREELKRIKSLIYNRLNNIQLYTAYRQPTFFLSMGDYLSRHEAQQDLMRIQDLVNSPILVESKVKLKP